MQWSLHAVRKGRPTIPSSPVQLMLARRRLAGERFCKAGMEILSVEKQSGAVAPHPPGSAHVGNLRKYPRNAIPWMAVFPFGLARLLKPFKESLAGCGKTDFQVGI
jgi:hypothetical protein